MDVLIATQRGRPNISRCLAASAWSAVISARKITGTSRHPSSSLLVDAELKSLLLLSLSRLQQQQASYSLNDLSLVFKRREIPEIQQQCYPPRCYRLLCRFDLHELYRMYSVIR